ncbi:hypothetical protein [Pseudaestuariivita sp.]|uniref:hypothetical protein n=1 Tax=Pseudaestuariivita sp. TaxID=2211669 RepID=UPI00405833FA
MEQEKLKAEISLLSAETEKISAEIRKMERERSLAPVVVATGVLLSIIGLIRLLM